MVSHRWVHSAISLSRSKVPGMITDGALIQQKVATEVCISKKRGGDQRTANTHEDYLLQVQAV